MDLQINSRCLTCYKNKHIELPKVITSLMTAFVTIGSGPCSLGKPVPIFCRNVKCVFRK